MDVSDKPKQDFKQAVGLLEVLRHVRYLNVIDLRGNLIPIQSLIYFQKAGKHPCLGFLSTDLQGLDLYLFSYEQG